MTTAIFDFATGAVALLYALLAVAAVAWIWSILYRKWGRS
jgi:hypothetical protein